MKIKTVKLNNVYLANYGGSEVKAVCTDTKNQMFEFKDPYFNTYRFGFFMKSDLIKDLGRNVPTN